MYGNSVDDNRRNVVSSCTLIWWQISKEENLISASNYRVNQFIRVKEVRLIGANNENVGVVSVEEARRMAQEADLDLVEVAPNSVPPVCRIMDFGKFLYERTKKEREARKSQTKIEVKEIHLRPKTTAHHRSFKVRSARNWLEEGMKVIVRIRFKGREIDYVDLGLQDLKEVAEDLVDVAIVEKPPIMEGKSVLMVLAPSKPGKKKPQSQPQPNE